MAFNGVSENGRIYPPGEICLLRVLMSRGSSIGFTCMTYSKVNDSNDMIYSICSTTFILESFN